MRALARVRRLVARFLPARRRGGDAGLAGMTNEELDRWLRRP